MHRVADCQSHGLGIRSGTCTKKGTIPRPVFPGSQMKIYGIDFTSRPGRRKPLTCLECRLEGDALRTDELIEWSGFGAFEAALLQPGPWVMGIDFPFGLPRKFVENIGWPLTWTGYVDHVRSVAMDLTADPSGDQHDALLCAIQAASAWRLRTRSFGIPEGTDPVEGWIAGSAITKSCR